MVEIRTKDEFNDIIHNNDVVLIKFGAEWCGPCKTMHGVIESLEKNIEGVTICEADVEEIEDLTTELRIRNIPTTLIFKNGNIVERIVGTYSMEDLIKKIKTHL